jgi:hypothetical protein
MYDAAFECEVNVVRQTPAVSYAKAEMMNRRSSGLWAVAYLLIMLSFDGGTASATDFFILVSDVDDTVKITNVLDRDDIFKGAVSKLIFAGMPELYRQILGPDSSAERLRFLSSSPGILDHRVRKLLKDSNFPAHELTLRSLPELFFSSIKDYKTKHMQELCGLSPNKCLLIGDDTGSDPEVYAAFSASKPNQVLAIYIHRITGRKLPTGSLPFVTAYDIAIHEFLAHRLSEQQAAVVGNAVLASNDRTFLPDFQACPGEHEDIPALPDSLATLKARIEVRLTAVCESNKKQ